ncbi:hypothetical protein K6T82_03415 [Flavobacterium sp. 17A]|uniref:Lipoprotein n=2 Tax=Flavobacterium TaxID=237 RepID=A0A9X1H8C1_9FLAO|nr:MULTISPECIES: hypothetical protein [Flavobacterium]MBW1655929.1 hypothetical protein [Flavobacterium quisquiliarum]MBZ4033799.1 hypothetical protein [Flavobacterium potami]WDF58116.1 hypothetical protein PQ462_15475 [Flavobacterium sp. KACC 22758]WET03373.1 hypothetical protein P0R33_03345 [Flavobacterium sp. YJ01]
MKTILKTSFLTLIFTLVLSCKNNQNSSTDPYADETDSTQAAVDSIGADSDTTRTSTNGTTGATGEGSTGSGSDGTTQKGTTTINKDSTSNSKGSK